MKLPADCPYAVTAPKRILGDVALPCCRAHCLFGSLSDGKVPLCRSWGTEVYRFTWDSSFDGRAVVRIARLGDEIRLFRLHRPSPFARPERGEASLMPCDWVRVQEAVIATNFWALDPAGEQWGLDGAFWTIEGRRKDIFHAVHRWSPHGAIHDLGRLFFAFAGQPLAGANLF